MTAALSSLRSFCDKPKEVKLITLCRDHRSYALFIYCFTHYMGSIGTTETSGTIYQSTLRIIKEEQRS